MDLTAQDIITARIPQAPQARIDALLPLAELQIKENWGECRVSGVALLTLHWLASENMNGGTTDNSGSGEAGSITEKKEGDLSLKRDNPASNLEGLSASDLYLVTTQYGQELIHLRKGCFMLPMSRAGGWL